MSNPDRIVALGLLSHTDLRTLGTAFKRAYPIDEVPCFNELLLAIDDADRDLWRERDAQGTEVRHETPGPTIR